MLNYIWAGLIITSFLFAIGNDIRDVSRDTYRNGQPLPVALAFPDGNDSAARRVPVEIRIDPSRYRAFYRTDQHPDSSYAGYICSGPRPAPSSAFTAGAKLPSPSPPSPRSRARAIRSCRAAWSTRPA